MGKHTDERISQAVEAVLSYRRTLEPYTKAPIKEWTGGGDPDTGNLIFPHPTYHPAVGELLAALGKFLSLWTPVATDYIATAGRFLDDQDAIGTASPNEVKALLTYVFRGEKFCDGFRGGQLKSGLVTALLDRLHELHQAGEIASDEDAF